MHVYQNVGFSFNLALHFGSLNLQLNNVFLIEYLLEMTWLQEKRRK